MSKSVWIDTDVAIGTSTPEGRYADVDDAFAMIQLFKAPQINVVGISTVFGNTDVDTATRLAQDLSQRFGGGVPVYRGAAEGTNLALVTPNEAVEALAAALEAEVMDVLAIGPATNLGLLLLLYPKLASRIRTVVLVAGRRQVKQHFIVGMQHYPPFADLNFDLDNHAVRVLIQSGVPIVLHPFEISHKVWITAEDLDQLAQGDEAAAYLAKHSRAWLQQWQPYGCTGFNPFDVLASAFLVEPDGFEWDLLPVRFEIHPDDTQPQQKAFKRYLLLNESQPGLRRLRYCHTPPADLKARLMQQLLR
jgi:pyrimidine-specific ribonucleoside hydrolase